MPTEQTQLEYYHYYRASQRRVQQWVQKTSLELQAVTTTNTNTTTPTTAGAVGKSSDLRLIDGGVRVNEEHSAGSGDGSGSKQRRKGSRRKSPPPYADNNNLTKSRGHSSSSRKKSRKLYNSSSDGRPLAISSLLPFGLFPLMIFALTPPSVATLFSATILLAGYFCVDYNQKESISDKL